MSAGIVCLVAAIGAFVIRRDEAGMLLLFLALFSFAGGSRRHDY